MTTKALITFFLITGFVWGGFIVFASLAMRKEKGKEEDRRRASGGGTAS